MVAILKGLVEDGEMALSDGRCILRRPAGAEHAQAGADSSTVWLHPNFRLIVLANRPGFPFLGNDFFRESGDVLSVHVVDNPDPVSETTLLKAYGQPHRTDAAEHSHFALTPCTRPQARMCPMS